MNLQVWIRKVGLKEASAILEVKERTVAAWLYGTRTPRPEMARLITERTPVTLEGIYALPQPEHAAQQQS